ncbi:hypothetical protein HYZ97_00950 [Candidatus Pacearchaeota archaeon]|nr:hypothetical protein [Candidatus Pacearchaeota archaeon]
MKRITSLASLLLAAGCVTNYSDADFTAIKQRESDALSEQADKPVALVLPVYAPAEPKLGFWQAKQLAQTYASLPNYAGTIGFSYPSGISFEELNLTGIRNSYMPLLARLQKTVPESDIVSKLMLGKPNHSSRSAQEYQLSNSSGLQGIVFVAADKEKKNFLVQMHKTKDVHKDSYTIALEFGTPDLRVQNSILPIDAITHAALDTGIGWLIGGPVGAAGFAGHTFISEPLARIEGNQMPKTTRRVRGQMYITGDTLREAHVKTIIEEAARHNTRMILAIECPEGAGFIYLNKIPENLYMDKNKVLFTTSEGDARWLVEMLLHLTKATAVLGVDKEVIHIITTPAGVSGGESAGPGGR